MPNTDLLAIEEARPLIGRRSYRSFAQDFYSLSLSAWQMGLSYTFSIKFSVALAVLFRANGNDPEHVAALGITQSLSNFTAIIALSELLALSIMAGNYIGVLSRDIPDEERPIYRRNVGDIYRAGLIVSASVASAGFFPLYFSENLLIALGQDPAVARIVQQFSRAYAPGIFPLLIRVCSEQMFFARGHYRLAMIIAIANLAFGITLAGIMGGGWFGREPSVEGLGYAYLVEDVTTALAYVACLLWHRDFREFPFFRLAEASSISILRHTKDLIREGGSISLSMIIEMSMAFVLTLFAGIEGSTQQAAWATAMQFVFFAGIPILSFGAATGQEQSRMMGAALTQAGERRLQIQRVRQFVLRARLITPANLMPFCLALIIFPQALNALVGGNTKSDLHALRIVVPLISGVVVGDSVRYQVLQNLRASFDWVTPTILNSIGLLAGFLSASIFLEGGSSNIAMLALSYLAGIIASTSLLLRRWGQRGTEDALIEAQTQHDAATQAIEQRIREEVAAETIQPHQRGTAWASLFSDKKPLAATRDHDEESLSASEEHVSINALS